MHVSINSIDNLIAEPEFLNFEGAHESIPPGYVAWTRICKRLRSPGIDFAGLCSLASRYDK
jgi:hypothetical protein